MAASISGVLTLLIVLVFAPLMAYLYNRYCSEWCSSRWNASKKRMSETALGRRLSMDGIRRRLSRFSRRQTSSGTDDGVAITQSMTASMLLQQEAHRNEFDDTRSTSAVLFGLIGSAVGLGNVYRFPFIIAGNGGGSALIIYCLCLALVAYPLFLYESVVGYYIRKPPIQALSIINRRWSTVALGQFIMLFLVLGYYSTITSYCLVFLVGSCKDPMPWTAEAQGTETDAEAAQKYWYDDVLNNFSPEELETRSNGDLGGLNGSVVGALAVTWFLTFMAMAFGKDLVEQITRVTVIAPIFIMILMVIAANTLPGSSDGIAFYIGKFDASVFSDIAVWAVCLGQVVFSLGPGLGVAMSYASSLDDPEVNVAKTCAFVAIVNALFSIFGGFYTFAVVGNVAYVTEEPIQDITDNAGQGLAFLVAPVAMNSFGSGANIMSVLFFLMLFTLGIDSLFAYVETIVAFIDGTAHLFKKEQYLRRMATMAFTCLALFLTAIPYASRLSTYMTVVIDYFSNTIGLLFSCFTIMLAICFDFKYKRILDSMLGTGHPISKWYATPTFFFFAPIGSLFLAMYLLINTIIDPFPDYKELGILDDLSSLIAIGWTMLAVLLVCYFGNLWRCESSSLPPLTPEEDNIGEEETKKVQDEADFEDEELNDDSGELKTVELAEQQADLVEDAPNVDEVSRVEQAVDVEA